MTESRPTPERFVRDRIASFYAGADLAEWAGNGLFPVTVLTPQLRIVVPDARSFIERMEVLRGGFERMGVAGIEMEVRSISRPSEVEATVATRNTRLNSAGEPLGEHNALYILGFAGGSWRFRAICMHDMDADETGIREKVARILAGQDRTDI